MTDFLQDKVQPAEGRTIIDDVLKQVNHSLERARVSLTEMKDSSLQKNAAERDLIKKRVQHHISTLRSSIRQLDAALLDAANKATTAV